MNNFHTPVLLQEVLSGLKIEPGQKYIDATIGGGGHGFEILKKGGILLGIDVDTEALEFVKRRWKVECGNWNTVEENLKLARGNFRDIDTIAHLNKFEKVKGIIFDLGVSSHQIDEAGRGFSFQKEGPLDMRMSQDLQIKALDLVNALNKGELYEIFTKLGEESGARAISEHIIRARSIEPIRTTSDLAKLIFPTARPKIFQALRIAVNDELNAIREALPKALELLESGGRMLVISFHSLEDRIVKQQFMKFENENKGIIVTKKPIIPNSEELQRNRRSMSSKLRIFEKK